MLKYNSIFCKVKKKKWIFPNKYPFFLVFHLFYSHKIQFTITKRKFNISDIEFSIFDFPISM